MVKFLQKKPATCSICLQEKMIFKAMSGSGHKLAYCKDCYDKYYARIEEEVKKQIAEMIKAKRMIGMKDALALTKKISGEIQAEDIKRIEEKGDAL